MLHDHHHRPSAVSSVVRAHANAGAAVRSTTSWVTWLWVADVVKLAQDGREEGESSTSSKDTFAQRLTRDWITIPDAPVPGVVCITYWSSEQACLCNEESQPANKEYSRWNFGKELQLIWPGWHDLYLFLHNKLYLKVPTKEKFS
jgi:hypothetical protein